MAKTRITLRLYRAHDLDLITFTEMHELDIRKAVYCALSSFVSGELFLIEIPERREEVQNLRRVYSLVLILDDEKEQDAKMLEVLSKIESGRRNNFLKNLLRLYLCNPMSEDFLVNEGDAEYFYEKFEIFRKGRKIADLSELKPVRKEKKAEGASISAASKASGKKKTVSAPKKKQEVLRGEPEISAPDLEGAAGKSDEPEYTWEGEKADNFTGSMSAYETYGDGGSETSEHEEDASDIFASILGQ